MRKHRSIAAHIILRGFITLLPIIVSGGLLLVLSWQIDYQSVLERLRLISLWSLFAGVAAFLGNIILAAQRFSLIARDVTGVRPSFRKTLKINFLSLFLVYFVPVAAMADAARIAAGCQMLAFSPAISVRCVIHDRILALSGFVFSAGLVLPLLIWLQVESWAVTVTMLLVAGATLLGAVVWIIALKGRGSSRSVNAFIERSAQQLTAHLTGRRRLARQVAVALGTGLMAALQLYVLAAGLGIALPFVAALALTPLISLAQVLPFLYGGYGAREAAAGALIGGSWASPDAAVALGLAIGLTNLIASLPWVLVTGRFTYEAVVRAFTGRRDITDRAN